MMKAQGPNYHRPHKQQRKPLAKTQSGNAAVFYVVAAVAALLLVAFLLMKGRGKPDDPQQASETRPSPTTEREHAYSAEAGTRPRSDAQAPQSPPQPTAPAQPTTPLRVDGLPSAIQALTGTWKPQPMKEDGVLVVPKKIIRLCAELMITETTDSTRIEVMKIERYDSEKRALYATVGEPTGLPKDKTPLVFFFSEDSKTVNLGLANTEYGTVKTRYALEKVSDDPGPIEQHRKSVADAQKEDRARTLEAKASMRASAVKGIAQAFVEDEQRDILMADIIVGMKAKGITWPRRYNEQSVAYSMREYSISQTEINEAIAAFRANKQFEEMRKRITTEAQKLRVDLAQ
ncbi:MAG TPA: hypothetical protein VGP72_03850 [Planctomycetota bacterium]